jgi:hypothetical protein
VKFAGAGRHAGRGVPQLDEKIVLRWSAAGAAASRFRANYCLPGSSVRSRVRRVGQRRRSGTSRSRRPSANAAERAESRR